MLGYPFPPTTFQNVVFTHLKGFGVFPSDVLMFIEVESGVWTTMNMMQCGCRVNTSYGCFRKKIVPPPIINFNSVFHFLTIHFGGPPYFWKHPYDIHGAYKRWTSRCQLFYPTKNGKVVAGKGCCQGWLYVSIEMSKIPYPVIQQVIQKALFKAYLK